MKKLTTNQKKYITKLIDAIKTQRKIENKYKHLIIYDCDVYTNFHLFIEKSINFLHNEFGLIGDADADGLLYWFIYENDLGAKGLETSYENGKLKKQIKTIQDLFWAIEQEINTKG